MLGDGGYGGGCVGSEGVAWPERCCVGENIGLAWGQGGQGGLERGAVSLPSGELAASQEVFSVTRGGEGRLSRTGRELTCSVRAVAVALAVAVMAEDFMAILVR